MKAPKKGTPFNSIAAIGYPARRDPEVVISEKTARLFNSFPTFFYWGAHALGNFLFKVFFRMKKEGTENIPKDGALIFAGNHISHIDPVAIALCYDRQVFFMAKHSLFEQQPWKFVVSNLGAFPVVRGTVDRKAIKTARKHLREGHVVGIFPEGTRNKGIENSSHQGVAWLASRANCPVVPVAVTGTNRIMPNGIKSLRLSKVTVRFGEPIMPEKNLDPLFNTIIGGINDLLNQNGNMAKDYAGTGHGNA
ncbi:MAG: 1-acyl-sn-glycerol-3-phosphate acyltransferase [Actinobacteria bacterium]|nr:1-acyl-sn-glycerol-3-phosphate acyltransferase [Actinomycetota bacterium]